MKAFEIVEAFEQALCKYTGAKYAVVVNSCTMAILIACAYHKVETVTIPKHTYVSVPMSIIHAGGKVKFENLLWNGMYQLKPYPIWDSARWIHKDIYNQSMRGQFICLSFHWAKQLNIGRGGAILHDDEKADIWLRKARFDGRTPYVKPKDDMVEILGWNCYMSPNLAAEGLSRLPYLPEYNNPLPMDEYPDLSQLPVFKNK